MSEQEIASTENNQKRFKRKKDPRDVVTPDAFTVSDDVLGKPLATPKRRAMAIIIDLIIIQQLTHIDSFILGMGVAAVLFILSSQKKQKSVGRGIGTIVKYIGVALVLAVIIIEVWQYQSGNELSILRSPDVTIEKTEIDNSLSTEQQLAIAKDRIEELEARDYDLFELVEQIAKQLGYGFGWAAVYFTLCLYLSNGQTLGKWLCRIKVVQLDGRRIGIWSALGRYGGYAASFVTGLSGFFQIYWDANRQGLHDKVSGTVVICLRRAAKQEARTTSLTADESKQDTSSNG